MLPILPPTLRKPPDKPIKATIKGVAKGKLANTSQSKDTNLVFITKWLPQLSNMLPPTQLEVTLTQLQTSPTHQQDAAPREKLPFKREPMTIR
ncbi:hypothetical protein GOBAR_AA37340 [Gossypium barbadense]|uniref:Uncharacterized protein n=1 Tax=Gossypium barbadense TaxID=3634 RepID=A0A2P5VX11_GOSBA|nr:hypothetical protein GOBAR_AA37340 [Gossypium barbadense]